MSKEQDPLDPESDIFWEGPEAIRQNLQKSSVSTEPDEPYSLKAPAPGPGPSISREVINTNTTLKRPAGNCPGGSGVQWVLSWLLTNSLSSSGPFAPNHKEPAELSEPEIKRLKETAKTFGYGRNETLDRLACYYWDCPPPATNQIFPGVTWSRSTKLRRASGNFTLGRLRPTPPREILNNTSRPSAMLTSSRLLEVKTQGRPKVAWTIPRLYWI